MTTNKPTTSDVIASEFYLFVLWSIHHGASLATLKLMRPKISGVPSVVKVINQLEQLGCIFRDGSEYKLSDFGRHALLSLAEPKDDGKIHNDPTAPLRYKIETPIPSYGCYFPNTEVSVSDEGKRFKGKPKGEVKWLDIQLPYGHASESEMLDGV